MHIPDGFLDPKTWVTAAALSTGAIGYSVAKSREELDERQVPKLGIMAAFIFAAQMVNFPVGVGTSGHLLGAALATILLGPWSACLILSTILFIQCLAFQDGGLTALGANVFNMAVVGVLMAFVIYKLFSFISNSKAGRNVSVFLAAWASVFAASFMATLELSLSNQVQLSFAQIFAPMAGWHAVIGIGEGLITVVVVNFVERIGFVEAKNNMQAEVK